MPDSIKPKSSPVVPILLVTLAVVAAGVVGYLIPKSSAPIPIAPLSQEETLSPEATADIQTASERAEPSLDTSRTRSLGAWYYREMVDEFTDKSSAGAFIGDRDGKATLIIKCDEPGPIYAMMMSKEYIGEGALGVRDAVIRLDKQPAKRQLWAHGDSFAGIFDSALARQFAKSLIGVDQLAVRIRDYKSADHDFVFDISSGSEDMLAAVATGCGIAPFDTINR